MIYRLDILNDKEFEDLSQIILENELGISLQNFRSGSDGGIDLRYSGNEENTIIVQAKHYIRSKFSDLKTALKMERVKIASLAPTPNQYILTTSLPLNPAETAQIMQLLHPYIKSTQDIYGQDRIDNLIAKYPVVEKRMPKLWLTSAGVLQLILHNGINGRNEFYEKKILSRVGLYVPTKNFDQAIDKLKENRFIIITGEPGVGKTTISYLIICDLLANGHELLYITDKILDVESLLSADHNKKQVIFFDDFFGANLSEIINPKNSESALVNFIERIQSMQNKFLILTSRTTILNQASARFEKFKNAKLTEASKYIVEVSQYTKLDKARILYNHIYHSQLLIEHENAFLRDKNYLKVIDHRNFFPRLIEFVTSNPDFSQGEHTNYEQFIFRSLNYPNKIWEYAYEEQLTAEDQMLLCTIFSLGGYNVSMDKLEKAFEQRYKYEIAVNGFTRKADLFKKALRKLSDGFLQITKSSISESWFISFLNPSIGDFLINYLKDKPTERDRILFPALYFEQITTSFLGLKGFFNEEIGLQNQKNLYVRFKMVSGEMLSLSSLALPELKRLYIFLYFFDDLVDENTLADLTSQIDVKEIGQEQFSEMTYCLEFLMDYPTIKRRIQGNWSSIFGHLFTLGDDSSDFSGLLRLLSKYDITSDIWSIDDSFMSSVKVSINATFENTVDDIDISKIDTSLMQSLEEGDEGYSVNLISDEISDQYGEFLSECNLSDFKDDFIQEVNFNEEKHFESFKERFYDYDHDDYEPRFTNHESVPEDVNDAIDRLFER